MNIVIIKHLQEQKTRNPKTVHYRYNILVQYTIYHYRYNILGQMMARAILNNRPMGLQLAEYISKFIMDEPKNVLRDYETTDKNLYNSINSMNLEVIFQFNVFNDSYF